MSSAFSLNAKALAPPSPLPSASAAAISILPSNSVLNRSASAVCLLNLSLSISANKSVVGCLAAPAAVDIRPLNPLPVGGVDARFKPKLIKN